MQQLTSQGAKFKRMARSYYKNKPQAPLEYGDLKLGARCSLCVGTIPYGCSEGDGLTARIARSPGRYGPSLLLLPLLLLLELL